MPFARNHSTHYRPPQIINDVVGELPAFVKAFIDDRRFLPHLREKVTIETGIASAPGVGHVDISYAAIGGLIHRAAIAFNPRQVSQTFLTVNWHDRDFASILAIRIYADLQYHLLPCCLLEKAVNVVRRV